MRIDAAAVRPAAAPRASIAPRPAASSPAVPQQPDSVELTRRSEQLLRAAEQAVQAEAARAQRVADLRARIRAGKYTVDNAAVARALLKHE
ncbi:MAG TPA: flagellar biosynthesis anti-sigma factor FlgM [Dehalococcoidia bacterium]|nr:flagellar biosynthesis anti-sigma factor FlgM [Dehalococcoidia bacterium]